MKQGQSFVGVQIGIFGRDLDGLVEIGDRFRVVAGGIESFAEIVEGFGECGFKLEGLSEKGDSLIVLFFLEMLEALVIELDGFGRNIGIGDCEQRKTYRECCDSDRTTKQHALDLQGRRKFSGMPTRIEEVQGGRARKAMSCENYR